MLFSFPCKLNSFPSPPTLPMQTHTHEQACVGLYWPQCHNQRNTSYLVPPPKKKSLEASLQV